MSAFLNSLHQFLLRKWAKRLEQDAEYHRQAAAFHKQAAEHYRAKAWDIALAVQLADRRTCQKMGGHCTKISETEINAAQDELARAISKAGSTSGGSQ